MNKDEMNYITSNVVCRFSNLSDLKIDDGRISFMLPNTDLCINFVISEKAYDIIVTKILKNDALRVLQIPIDWLMKCVLSNASRIEKVCYKNFNETTTVRLPYDIPKVIVTNESMYYGAISIMYNGVYENVKNKIGDFYVLPSSVHEMICIPKHILDKRDLLYVVNEINNAPFMRKEDILANDIFEIIDGKLRSVFARYLYN